MKVARSTSGLHDLANHDETQNEDGDLATRTEVDVVARVLCAVSMHTSLNDALMSFYSSLPPQDARERSSLVLDRMQKILPHELSGDLSDRCGYARPWAEQSEKMDTKDGRSLVYRFALPATYLIGAMMLALSVVGSITTVHYLLGH